ncbi:hypothetical protein QQ045_024632 [Rhodiola kirilowii]
MGNEGIIPYPTRTLMKVSFHIEDAFLSRNGLEHKSTITVAATDTSQATEIPNPAYDEWFTIDQQIVSLLTTSLTDSVSQLTIGFDTSKAIWDCLSCHFSQQSTASAASLKPQLLELQKGSKTVDEYIRHAKSIADALASIGKPVPEEDLVLSTLHGLGSDYLMLRTALTQSSSLPNFSDLRARILAFDAQRSDPVSSSPVVTALLTQGREHRDSNRSDSDHREHDRQSYNRRNSRGRFRGRFNGRGGHNYHSRTPFSGQQLTPHHSSFSPWAGRMPWTQGLLGPSPNWCNNCHTNQHDSVRCPHRYSGPTTTPPFAGVHTASDSNWYPDTGATHHMTSSSIPESLPHTGPHNVFMGNGDSLPISHTSNLPISLGSSKFNLYNVFLVPSLRKNLLSVARFTKDNLVFFLFAPTFYQIYCLLTGRLYFRAHVRMVYIHYPFILNLLFRKPLSQFTPPFDTTGSVIHHYLFSLVLGLILAQRFKNVRHHVRYWNPRSVVNKQSQRSNRCNKTENIMEQVHAKQLSEYSEA